MSEELPVLNDARHQRFADLVLNGQQPAKAYAMAGYSAKTPASRATNSSRLLKNAEIQRYLAAMRQRAAQGMVLSLQAKREFLCRIVTTPLMGIDPRGKDGDLILKYKNTVTEVGGTEEIVKLDPLKAIELDNKLSGDDPESNAIGSLASALAGLSAGGPVEDRM